MRPYLTIRGKKRDGVQLSRRASAQHTHKILSSTSSSAPSPQRARGWERRCRLGAGAVAVGVSLGHVRLMGACWLEKIRGVTYKTYKREE